MHISLRVSAPMDGAEGSDSFRAEKLRVHVTESVVTKDFLFNVTESFPHKTSHDALCFRLITVSCNPSIANY
jgi:hypothetical protein